MYKKFWQRIQPPPACQRDMVKDTSTRTKSSSSSSSMTATAAATAAVLLLVGGAAAGYSCSTSTNTESYRHGYQQHQQQQQQQQGTHRPLGINNNNKNNNNRKRTYQTRADEYYQKYGKIPLPRVVHAVWNQQDDPNHCSNNNNNVRCSSTTTSTSHKILIVGDVHGCLEELIALVTKASMLHNDHQDFAAVILVGDLCNKGPYSAEVIRYVRKKSCQQQQQQQQMSLSKKTNDCCWFAVRGNHDDAALAAALGDVQRRQCKEKYGWVVDSLLSDEDVEWMSDLPYTIRIPCCRNDNCTAAECSNDELEMDKRDDVIVVHAGLLPGIPLHEQTVETMTTIRNVNRVQAQEKDEEEQQTQQQQQQQNQQREETSCAWAKLWHGPELVIFGHDAKRGLQKERYAIGLDTGACYGKKLTGIVLPEQEVVSVDSFQTYCKIREK